MFESLPICGDIVDVERICILYIYTYRPGVSRLSLIATYVLWKGGMGNLLLEFFAMYIGRYMS